MEIMPFLHNLRPKFGQKASAAVAIAVEIKPTATAVGFGLRSTPAYEHISLNHTDDRAHQSIDLDTYKL